MKKLFGNLPKPENHLASGVRFLRPAKMTFMTNMSNINHNNPCTQLKGLFRAIAFFGALTEVNHFPHFAFLVQSF